MKYSIYFRLKDAICYLLFAMKIYNGNCCIIYFRQLMRLPDYELLDEILFAYIEQQRSVDEIINSGADEKITRSILGKVNQNEYKRYQTPPILRISSKAFGTGRRMPLVAIY